MQDVEQRRHTRQGKRNEAKRYTLEQLPKPPELESSILRAIKADGFPTSRRTPQATTSRRPNCSGFSSRHTRTCADGTNRYSSGTGRNSRFVSYQRVEIKLEAALERMKEIQDDRDHWRRQPLLEDKRPLQQQQGLWGRLLKRK